MGEEGRKTSIFTEKSQIPIKLQIGFEIREKTKMKSSIFFIFLYLLCHLEAAKKANKVAIQEISDHKEFKKLMKTKTNVLVYFFDKPTSGKLINILRDVADKVKGTGTIVSVDCGQSDGKKLC